MSRYSTNPPGAVGLYDPRFEHDACGVGMVARLDNEPTHEVVTRAITALENLEHRGASGADPKTGDGAGILMQMPDELMRATCWLRAAAAGLLRRADVLPADRRRRARRAGGAASSARSKPRASGCSAGATCRSSPSTPAGSRAPAGPRSASSSWAPPSRSAAPPRGHDAGRLRAQALRDPPRLRARHGGLRPLHRLELLADDQLQGHADQLPAGGVLQRPARRALQERDGARALPLLDQHVPELGARPPLPGDLPQRRDQHRDGQRQLDACARERAAQRAVRGGPGEDPAGRQRRQLGLGDLRQRARAADARRALAARTRR